jgi:hypothetical protein
LSFAFENAVTFGFAFAFACTFGFAFALPFAVALPFGFSFGFGCTFAFAFAVGSGFTFSFAVGSPKPNRPKEGVWPLHRGPAVDCDTAFNFATSCTWSAPSQCHFS